jgi:hypothetical protein
MMFRFAVYTFFCTIIGYAKLRVVKLCCDRMTYLKWQHDCTSHAVCTTDDRDGVHALRRYLFNNSAMQPPRTQQWTLCSSAYAAVDAL